MKSIMHRIPAFVDTLSRRLNLGVEYLLFGLGISMSLIMAVQVFSRYALNSSLFWSEELARFMLVWLAFLGASLAYRRRVHPTLHSIAFLLAELTEGGRDR
jgi:TRAP-type C4-dicarboxylate transport system permease small subunit